MSCLYLSNTMLVILLYTALFTTIFNYKLQPLDIGIFGLLARQYCAQVSQNATFGAICIENH